LKSNESRVFSPTSEGGESNPDRSETSAVFPPIRTGRAANLDKLGRVGGRPAPAKLPYATRLTGVGARGLVPRLGSRLVRREGEICIVRFSS
jgi:hypothetical protein